MTAALLLAQARPHAGGGVAAGATARHHQGGRAAAGRPGASAPATVYVPLYLAGGGGYYNEPAPVQPVQEAPSVLLNPDFQPEVARPLLQDYSSAGLLEAPPLEQRQSRPAPAVIQPADQSPTIYLIAMKGGSIAAVLGWWIVGDSLHYITRNAERGQVPLQQVDRDFSIELNAQRNLEFKLEQ